MKSSGMRASSVSFSVVGAVLFDLPVDEWNRRGQEEAEKRSGECG
jgi:hypothetical protein